MRYLIRLLFVMLALLLVACSGESPAPTTEAPPTGAAVPPAIEVDPPTSAVVEGAMPTDPTTTGAPTTDVPSEATAEASPAAIPVAAANPPLPQGISLPPGFHIGYYAENVPNARSMTLSPDGTLFVGTREGSLYAIRDTNQDYVADEVMTLAQDMNSPNGVAVRDGALYVAEIDRILRYDNIEAALPNLPEPVVINDSYPGDGTHGWKFIAFGPDGRLYVPVGSPCDTCLIEGTPYGKITSLAADGSDLQVFADGLRNSVGFDWHPETGDLWFTDNGPDGLGDDLPPDELNRATGAGLHFGFPYCHGGTVADPGFGSERPCSEFTPPAQPLGPHVAALGLRFYTGAQFPEEYRNQIFIAEHGSWARAEPLGYRVTLVRLEGDEAVSYEPFAEGWLGADGRSWGRPVDIQVMPDGSLLVSDDKAGAIYRIWYDADAG